MFLNSFTQRQQQRGSLSKCSYWLGFNCDICNTTKKRENQHAFGGRLILARMPCAIWNVVTILTLEKYEGSASNQDITSSR